MIEWDKDDIEILNFMKVDVLGLGMLGCMRRAFDLLRAHGKGDHDLSTIPPDDKPTYAMIQRADTLGTFQIESRAQMSMLPRLKPKKFYDLVIQVAIVRPGPIQGDMVHPYLRRRDGKEKPEYPKPELKAVLEKTLGVPLFQEQAMRVAIECAGFSAGKADQFRRSMATFKHTGGVSKFHDELVAGMVANGYAQDFAERTFRQLEGFGSYGFPESHAASFALIAYASSWMKCHHPAIFAASLLNSQPMGFYAPAQIVRDARAHAVEVRPADVNVSEWDCTLETAANGDLAIRLGLRMVKGLGKDEADDIVKARGCDLFRSVEELWRRSGASVRALKKLAEADAFSGSLKLARRDALWSIRALCDETLPLFAATDRGGRPLPEAIEPQVAIRPMSAGREVVEDYGSTGLSLRRHPVGFLRGDLAGRGIVSTASVAAARAGDWMTTAGLVLVRQRPGSAKGVIFVTIEDEEGIANVVVWKSLFEKQRRVLLGAGLLGVRGKVQRASDVVHLVAHHLIDLTPLLRTVGIRDETGRATETPGGSSIAVRPRDFR